MADETETPATEHRRTATHRRSGCAARRAAAPAPAAPPLRRRMPRTPAAPARAAAAGGAAAGFRRQDDHVAALGGAAAAKAAATPAAAAAAATPRDPDDTSPLLTRRAWMGLAWGAFSAASAAALAATGRFMFPNVLNEPPQQFKAGFPSEYGMGVDERWKEKFGVWIVRTPDDVVAAGERLLRAARHLHASRAARRTSCRPRASSSARATAAGSGPTGINSRARRRGRSSARASCWPTTARSWSTRRGSSSTSWDSGPIRRRF